jgi:nicotinate-nucleotide pyrophosphorylase (carboxylating)
MIYPPAPQIIHHEVHQAFEEDLHHSTDWSATLIDPHKNSSAFIITKQEMVVCGIPWVNASFNFYNNPSIQLNWLVKEGDLIPAETILCQINGNARTILTSERTALNFLQTLSGTATLTHKYVLAVAPYKVQILDTRKTIPGLRHAQKYAVRVGGGYNQRMGLYDGVLIKENHIIAHEGITQVLAHAQNVTPKAIPLQIEVETLAQLKEAVAAGAKLILLDNMSLTEINTAVNYCKNLNISLEVSGNVNLNNVPAYAATGVQRISIGALTKNLEAIDLSLRFA